MNARSVYNKKEEFERLVQQYEVDLVFMTETWERDDEPLVDLIELENFKIVTEVQQRNETGGKTAIFISEDKSYIIGF